MLQQALQALKYLAEKSPRRLDIDKSLLDKMIIVRLISLVDPSLELYSLSDYGKMVHGEINRSATNAMLKTLEKYL